MSEPEMINEAAEGQSQLTEVLGAAVIVGGVVVAWFAEFDEAAQEWCTENHFGQWLAWRAKPPEIVPLTEAEYDKVMTEAAEMVKSFKAAPEAPNCSHKPRA